MTGRIRGVATAQDESKCITVNYTAALVTQKIFTAAFPMLLVDITGVTRVAGSGGAATITFFKSASGVTVANGVALNTGSFNLVGTADTNQVLTLVSNQDSLTLQVGDSIGYVLTGTATNAVGCVTITLEPA